MARSTDISPPDFNSRTRAHEYGGGAYAVRDGIIVSSDFVDQRAYRLGGPEPFRLRLNPSSPPAIATPITPFTTIW